MGAHEDLEAAVLRAARDLLDEGRLALVADDVHCSCVAFLWGNG